MKLYKSVLPHDPEFRMPSDEPETIKRDWGGLFRDITTIIPMAICGWIIGHQIDVSLIRSHLKIDPATYIQTGQDIDSSGLYICIEPNTWSQVKQYKGGVKPPVDNINVDAKAAHIQHGASLPSTCKANEDMFFKTDGLHPAATGSTLRFAAIEGDSISSAAATAITDGTLHTGLNGQIAIYNEAHTSKQVKAVIKQMRKAARNGR